VGGLHPEAAHFQIPTGTREDAGAMPVDASPSLTLAAFWNLFAFLARFREADGRAITGLALCRLPDRSLGRTASPNRWGRDFVTRRQCEKIWKSISVWVAADFDPPSPACLQVCSGPRRATCERHCAPRLELQYRHRGQRGWWHKASSIRYSGRVPRSAP